MRAARGHTWLSACAVALFGSLTSARASGDDANQAAVRQTEQPSTVRFRALGSLADSRLANLETLIETELAGSGVRFVIDRSELGVTPWVTQTAREPEVLVVVVLDTREEDHWQVTIVDAARRRAIRRRLPGGVAEDAAAVEAVASIVVSAVTALRDGLEVASQPVEEVLDGGTAAVTPAAVKPDTSQKAHKSSTPSEQAERGQAETQQTEAQAVGVGASLFGSAVSFSEPEPVTVGLGLGLEFTFFSELQVSLSAARFRDAVFESPFGEFRTGRSLLQFGVGHLFGVGAFELGVEATFLAELLDRESGQPAPGASALAASHLSRYGGLVGFSARYPERSLVGLELRLGGGYLPRVVQFVTSPNNYVIAELWPWVLLAEFGLEVRLY